MYHGRKSSLSSGFSVMSAATLPSWSLISRSAPVFARFKSERNGMIQGKHPHQVRIRCEINYMRDTGRA